MELELATVSDIVDELRRRHMRFVMVAVEPTNSQVEATVINAAQGIDAKDMLGLVKLAWQEVMNEDGDSGHGGPSPS